MTNRLGPNVWDQFRRWQEELKGTFEPGALARTLLSPAYPAVNIWEDGENVYADAELPGVPNDRLEVTVNGQELVLAGERPEPAAGGTWHHRERSAGPFKRSLTLPSAVEVDQVEARFDQGVLKLKMPKKPEARGRRVPVTDG